MVIRSSMVEEDEEAFAKGAEERVRVGGGASQFTPFYKFDRGLILGTTPEFMAT